MLVWAIAAAKKTLPPQSSTQWTQGFRAALYLRDDTSAALAQAFDAYLNSAELVYEVPTIAHRPVCSAIAITTRVTPVEECSHCPPQPPLSRQSRVQRT